MHDLVGQTRTYRFVKRGLDIAVASAFLLVAALPMGVIAALIWVGDRHASVLYRQRRAGMNGRPIDVLKFRTMVPNADALKDELRSQSVVSWPDFNLKEDPRVTKLGRFLRKTSLDELPQLWCVLKGDMSLVGPRPTSFGPETYDLWQTERLRFRPGVTGPWQVAGRGKMEFDERCRLEISFFRKPSLFAELKLLVLTIPALLRHPGAA
jgi:lipopolysaccharide/colanic/teichoic acid biosynthesis glycosyltransferase